MLFAKLMVLEALYVLSGDALYSPYVDKWVNQKKKDLHLKDAKEKGAQWLLVLWEVRSMNYRYVPIFDKEENEMWEHRLKNTAKVKTCWTFVERIAL